MKLLLQRNFFTEVKENFISYGKFEIRAFRYKSGVEALSIENSRCSFVFTPFKGQQIWHYKVDGEELSMKTTIKEPQNTDVYLENYGGFLYHCGVLSFGAPGAGHPQHGEIPNAEYDSAYVVCGEDEGGKYIILGGELNHDTAFIRKYKFTPEIKLYENSAVFNIKVCLENMRNHPMEYMYLCHINFKPIAGAEIVYSGKVSKVYKSNATGTLLEYMENIEKEPAVHHIVGNKDEVYDPEVCMLIDYKGDENNRAYTMQYTNDGACYVSHPTDALPMAIRWISRTCDEDSMGMVLPATSEHLGYVYAKENGQIKTLGANEKLEFYIEAGYLDKDDSEIIREKVNRI